MGMGKGVEDWGLGISVIGAWPARGIYALRSLDYARTFLYL